METNMGYVEGKTAGVRVVAVDLRISRGGVMPKIKYTEMNFQDKSLALIDQANAIISEYESQGFDLTLRQLYYQFVARDIIPNTQKSYKNLGGLINDARLAGLVDWHAIVDRTRELRSLPHWSSPDEIVSSCAEQFNIDLWKTQKYRPEVWIEKDALAGVFLRVCQALDVPLFSCRGYTSQSEMWAGAMRIKQHLKNKQVPVIFHFGDHDPSGRDMSRDIQDRLMLFLNGYVVFHRLALTIEQVRQYNPPSNPAKITDSRANAYIAEFGNESWELDALEPSVLEGLVRKAIAGIVSKKKMSIAQEVQRSHRETLEKISRNFSAVEEFVSAQEQGE